MAQNVMTERERIEQAVTRFFHMCNTHCPANLAPLMTGDVELTAERASRGQEDAHAYFVWLWQTRPDLTFRVEHVLVDGVSAAAEVTVEEQGQRREGCVIFHFRDGLIRRIRFYESVVSKS